MKIKGPKYYKMRRYILVISMQLMASIIASCGSGDNNTSLGIENRASIPGYTMPAKEYSDSGSLPGDALPAKEYSDSASLLGAALPAKEYSYRTKRVIEDLYVSKKGDGGTSRMSKNAILFFGRDVLTGEGTCNARLLHSEFASLPELPANADWGMRKMYSETISGLAAFDSLVISTTPEKKSDVSVGIPGTGKVRISLTSSDEIHTVNPINLINVDGHDYIVVKPSSREFSPVWDDILRSSKMTVAVNSITAYDYDLEVLSDLLDAVDYLCGDGATERSPDWYR